MFEEDKSESDVKLIWMIFFFLLGLE